MGSCSSKQNTDADSLTSPYTYQPIPDADGPVWLLRHDQEETEVKEVCGQGTHILDKGPVETENVNVPTESCAGYLVPHSYDEIGSLSDCDYSTELPDRQQERPRLPLPFGHCCKPWKEWWDPIHHSSLEEEGLSVEEKRMHSNAVRPIPVLPPRVPRILSEYEEYEEFQQVEQDYINHAALRVNNKPSEENGAYDLYLILDSIPLVPRVNSLCTEENGDAAAPSQSDKFEELDNLDSIFQQEGNSDDDKIDYINDFTYKTESDNSICFQKEANSVDDDKNNDINDYYGKTKESDRREPRELQSLFRCKKAPIPAPRVSKVHGPVQQVQLAYEEENHITVPASSQEIRTTSIEFEENQVFDSDCSFLEIAEGECGDSTEGTKKEETSADDQNDNDITEVDNTTDSEKQVHQKEAALNDDVIVEERLTRHNSLFKTMNIPQILPHLHPVLSQSDVETVRKKGNRKNYEVAWLVLRQKLKESTDEKKWDVLLEGLKASGHQAQALALSGTSIEATDSQREILRTLTPELRELITPDDIMPHLLSAGVITNEDHELVRRHQSNRGPIAAAELLLDRVPRKHPEWYSQLKHACEEAKHEHVAELLGSAEGGVPIEVTKTHPVKRKLAKNGRKLERKYDEFSQDIGRFKTEEAEQDTEHVRDLVYNYADKERKNDTKGATRNKYMNSQMHSDESSCQSFGINSTEQRELFNEQYFRKQGSLNSMLEGNESEDFKHKLSLIVAEQRRLEQETKEKLKLAEALDQMNKILAEKRAADKVFSEQWMRYRALTEPDIVEDCEGSDQAQHQTNTACYQGNDDRTGISGSIDAEQEIMRRPAATKVLSDIDCRDSGIGTYNIYYVDESDIR